MSPNRQYVPSGGKWPQWADHFLAHLHEVLLAILAMAFGAVVLGSPGVTDFDILQQPSRGHLDVYRWPIALFLIVGGTGNLISTVKHFKDRSTYWLAKRLTLLMTAVGWGSLGVIAVNGRALVSGGLFLWFGVICLLSLLRTLIDQWRITQGIMGHEPR